MFFPPLTFPDSPVLDRHEDATSPTTFLARADQAPFNFTSDASDISDLLSALTCLDTDVSDIPDSEVSDLRTIDGSSRLYSKTNAHYLLPLDQEEFQRLDKQSTLLRLGMWGLLPLRDGIEEIVGKVGGDKVILDVGCGSGAWAVMMASLYTHIRVVAIDQASQPPEGLPGNVEWRRQDVNKGLKQYHGQYDIVHVQCIGAGITSYRVMLEEASKCLKPGGLAIFIEGDFDLLDEDQHTILEPAGESKPDGCYLQTWMQAVRRAQVRRCGLLGCDDSPETLDEGLWQFDSYDPSSCHTASIFTPMNPWPKSDLLEESLHYKITGTLMRQNVKSFVLATEQLLIEDGNAKDDVNEWMSQIREELESTGRFKPWYRWRAAWGRAHTGPLPLPLQEHIESYNGNPQRLPSERRQEAQGQLLSRVHKFTLPQCNSIWMYHGFFFVFMPPLDELSVISRFLIVVLDKGTLGDMVIAALEPHHLKSFDTSMSKSQISPKNEEIDEKTTKNPPLTQPKATVPPVQEHAADMTSEGHIILAMTKENSGWDVYNNEARKVDTELVKDWTTSLNFLLIFAAIFAAVLTAFIIESKKMLEQDPTEIMVDVMMFYTNNVANGTHKPYKRPEFEASTPAVVVNSLFFGSLSASLVAALASVVALQWVADYDAAITRGGSSPEDRAKRRQFRYAGVVWWKMSEVIAALPLLLYFSVMLFFAGLILWMWDTNQTVGVVVAGGTAIAVSFYVTSTMIAVAFVSAPFRTPLSRWIYTLCHLPISALYWLMRAMRISAIPDWIQTRHSIVTASYRREDRKVENTETLGRDALVWLANQISISQDSYRRLLLLVGELPTLKVEHLPSFEPNEASWYRIFDLLGWGCLRRGSSAIANAEEKRRGMEILQRCYRLPVIQNLVDPVGREDLTDYNYLGYWSQYCDLAEDDQWRINQELPNHLFLLLRDIPCPSAFSPREIDVTAKLAEWRNRTVKDALVWDEVFSSATSLPSDFFSSCVASFGNYCRAVYWHGMPPDMHEISLSTARKLVQIAVLRDDLSPDATVPLIRAYEAMQIGFIPLSRRSSPSCLTSPFQYGKCLQKGSFDDRAAHESMILLLSRRIGQTSAAERVLQVKDIIKMLWLRPSNPVLRNWNSLEGGELDSVEIDTRMMSDWITNVDSVPRILEILRHLAIAQGSDPHIGPLWRATVPDEVNDPHFVEALQNFDRLMGKGCSGDDHYTLINLICQDLEQEPYPDFDDYFTTSRLDSLSLLQDPCLRILVGCARGPDFLIAVTVPVAYGKARESSLTRVAEYVYKQFSAIDSPPALQLQASLWPMASGLYASPMQDAVIFAHLKRMFKYTVPCYGCLGGDGHLAFHLLIDAGRVEITQKVTLFGKIPLEGRSMAAPLGILSTLSAGERPSLASYLPRVEGNVLQALDEEIAEILSSQFHLLTMIWNTLEALSPQLPASLAVILVGIQKALQLPSDQRSAFILAPMSLKIRRLRDKMLARAYGTFAARKVVNEQADITSKLLISGLAVRSIFGSQNSRRISCARAVGDIQPAVGWLPLHEG